MLVEASVGVHPPSLTECSRSLCATRGATLACRVSYATLFFKVRPVALQTGFPLELTENSITIKNITDSKILQIAYSIFRSQPQRNATADAIQRSFLFWAVQARVRAHPRKRAPFLDRASAHSRGLWRFTRTNRASAYVTMHHFSSVQLGVSPPEPPKPCTIFQACKRACI